MSLSRTVRRSSHASTQNGPSPRAGSGHNAIYTVTLRPAVLAVGKLLLLPLAHAAPLGLRSLGISVLEDGGDADMSADAPNLFVYLSVAAVLVLLGGAFAGLTIALMGQDETYLQVIATSGDGNERKSARKVLSLLKKGKHWVLVTLLLSNVITNETLPIVLDRSLGGGWPAVLGSTVLIVIFGEIAPQSVCVRYGLGIGAWMAPFVLGLMWIMAPIAWPTAKLLDWLLGEDHGTTYKKTGLKTLVSLHKTMGTTPGDRLIQDEVTIINSVLDLKEKSVGSIMTPMQDVFTMSADTVLDEKMMDTILGQGYSRIPIHAPDNRMNFIGMLLVKILITYDPEDCKRVRDFALATLPETAPETSCLDIINFFQEGKSHMVLVSDFPGQDKGATGVVTLEDVIEELIGEEIIDESDVFVDVHKAIRRMAPAPRTRYNKNSVVTEIVGSEREGEDAGEDQPLLGESRKQSMSDSRPGATVLLRRKSSTASKDPKESAKPLPVRSNTTDLRLHLKHLGPSNVASKPRATKFTSVKIKPGVGTIPEDSATSPGADGAVARSQSISTPTPIPDSGEGSGLLKSAGRDASDAVQSHVAANYGTLGSPRNDVPRQESELFIDGTADANHMSASQASQLALRNTTQPPTQPPADSPAQQNGSASQPTTPANTKLVIGDASRTAPRDDGEDEADALADMQAPSRGASQPRRTTRSGSITENIVNMPDGFKKVVLETTSSSDERDEAHRAGQVDGAADGQELNGGAEHIKRRKKRGKKKKGTGGGGGAEE